VSQPPYPEPPVKYSGYSDLHFATEHQIRSPVILGGYDRGTLEASPGRVVFTGMRNLVDCPNVTAVGMARKTFPWVMLAVVAAAAALLVYLNSPVPFTWRQPLVYGIAFILLVVSARYWQERWVEVIYSDGGKPRRAYFRRDPVFFGSGAKRTRALYNELRSRVATA
jgi:hypothetical protein